MDKELLNESYFEAAMKEMVKRIGVEEKIVFIVASDDPDWCKETMLKLKSRSKTYTFNIIFTAGWQFNYLLNKSPKIPLGNPIYCQSIPIAFSVSVSLN